MICPMTVRQPRNTTSAITLPADSFGAALKFLRKRARLTQDELGRAVGYSREQIARLEKGSRLPDLTMLAALFVAALGLQQEPALVTQLLELAGAARQAAAPEETPPRITVTHHVAQRVEVRQLVIEPAGGSPLPTTAPVHQLPVPLLPLLGRDFELTQACQLLATEARLLTLVGAPGVGKSRLALAIGHQLAPTFAHRAALVLLAGVQNSADVAPTVAAALQLTPAATQTPAAAVRAYLAPRQLLLILDNCEHLLDAMPLLSTWLAAAPNVTFLCTSRMALDLYGEYEMAVGPLALPDLAQLPPLVELGQISAVKLFVDRARAVDHTFQLDVENRLAVAGLAVALDGLPLALELAAARTRTLTPQALLQQLINARQAYQPASHLLTQNKRDIAAHHRTLQEAIDWSYRLLSPAEQALFMGLGVFWGGCTAEAMAVVAGGDVLTLNGLVAANLVQRGVDLSPAGTPLPRLFLLETLRTFALEQLAAQGQLVSLQRRHADYFADYAQQIFIEIRGADQTPWLQRARLDHDNFRAALRFALRHQLGEVAVAIAGGLWWFWTRQGLLAEGSQWLAAALGAPCQATEPTLLHQQQRARALNGAGTLATEQSRFAEAHAYHLEGLALRRAIGDQAGEADVLHNLGLLARCEGDYGQALVWFAEGRTLSATLNSDPSYLVMDDINLAITAYEMGDLAAADRWATAAYQRATGHADQWIVAYVTTALAEIMSAQDEWARAAALATAASRLYEQLGDVQFLPEPLLLLAKTAYARGELAQAELLCQQVLLAYRTLDDQYGIANVLYLQAWLALAGAVANDTPEPAITAAATLYEQAYVLRAGVNRHISPREQAEYRQLAAALKAAGG